MFKIILSYQSSGPTCSALDCHKTEKKHWMHMETKYKAVTNKDYCLLWTIPCDIYIDNYNMKNNKQTLISFHYF